MFREEDIAAILLVSFCAYLIYQRTYSGRIYPPGPKGWPIIGNLFDIPKALAYKTYAQWSKELGSDILYLNAAGTPIVVLNSIEAANDLFEKRSSIYSNRDFFLRPHLTMASELLEGTRFIALMPYGEAWREARRLMQKHISPSDQAIYQTREVEFVRKFLLPNLLDTPQNFSEHIRNAVGASIISLAYGLPIRRLNDPWIQLAEEGMATITSGVVPGKYFVDAIPAMKYIPEWFPGATFQKEAREGRQRMRHFFNAPFQAAKQAISQGVAKSSFVSESLEATGSDRDSQRKQLVIENIGGMYIAGGTDSTVAGLSSFLLAMVCNPEIQYKAQKEIEKVVGTSRLPAFHDKPRMPYLAAVLKEVLRLVPFHSRDVNNQAYMFKRWQPIVPQGNAHTSTQDDIYRGYYIPKGTIVIANAWAMLNDEKIYSNPSLFNPERFLRNGELDFDVPDPDEVASFGFGRRICPGGHIGLSSFWITAASILACFNISKAVDEHGNEIHPKVEYSGKTVVAHPEPFQCTFTPRSKEAEALIHAEFDGSSDFI
ncbi:cytochrome P450 [Flammula alnicola]|nr:cytochrome P450 [Flammula alnicola]